MATVTVSATVRTKVVDPTPVHPKLTLVDDLGTRVVLPHAPIDAPLGNLGPTWEEVARDGDRPPLLVRTGPNLATLGLECTIVDSRRPDASMELYAFALTSMARQGRRVFVRNYGILVGNPWRIVSFDVSPFRREPGTNAIAGFTASIALKAASDAVVKVGSITGGAQAAAPPPARTVNVLHGETPEALAYRALGATSAVAELLDANGIRDPRLLTPGTTLKVP